MRRRVIKIFILFVIFIAALILSSVFLNRGSADTTADLNAPTLPTVAFMVEDQEMNVLEGHKSPMNLSSVRDTILPFSLQEGITAIIKHEEVKTCNYQITTPDGKTELKSGTAEIEDQKFQIQADDVLEENQEALLTIELDVHSAPIYYYTRIVPDTDIHILECKNFVQELQDAMLKKNNEALLTQVMEPSNEGDNYTLYQVTIHSDVKHAMWSNLEPSIVGEVNWEIKEARDAYTVILLQYKVACEGDNNSKEIYQVNEYFKVAYSESRMYLLDYNRLAEEEFNPSNVVLSSKGIVLGLASKNLSYLVSEDGQNIAFIQNNELWAYSVKDNVFSLVFSFSNSEKEDERNERNQHKIQIMSIEENGNMTFSVYGYMNRGLHEGQTGMSIYYYDVENDTIEEKIFIPSTDGMAVIEQEWNKLAYFNAQKNVLYVMMDGALQKLNFEEEEMTVLLEDLAEEQYVASDTGNLFAYQKDGVHVWDFHTEQTYDVEAKEGETILPLGFMGNDFVYGVTTEENKGTDSSGKEVQPMHRIEICNSQNEVVKVYEVPETYILSVTFEGNMITLKRAVRQGTTYSEISEDYITNNQQQANGEVALNAYWTDLKQNQYRIEIASGIKDKDAGVREPKFVLKESVVTLETRSTNQNYYAVYGKGELQGIYKEASQAVAEAEALSGLVISPDQNYVWESGNQVAWYRNFNIAGFVPQGGETSLAACVKKIFAYEGVSADVTTELQSSSVEEVMEKYLGKEVIRFTGSSSENMRYLMDKGVPVIAMTGANDALLLIGYDALNVTYVNTTSGGIGTVSFAKMDNMTDGSGNTYIGYVR